MNIKELLSKKLDDFERWIYWKRNLRFQRKKYKEERAAYEYNEQYLTQLITDYPGEDQRKANMRNDLVKTQQALQNLDLLLSHLKETK